MAQKILSITLGTTSAKIAEIVKTGNIGNPYRFLGLRTKEGK